MNEREQTKLRAAKQHGLNLNFSVVDWQSNGVEWRAIDWMVGRVQKSIAFAMLPESGPYLSKEKFIEEIKKQLTK